MTRLAFTSAILSLSLAAAASAHTDPDGYVPAAGATVADVPEIRLAFEKPTRVISITLNRGEDAIAIDRETGMDPVTAFLAVPARPLDPGDYAVAWRGMGPDGHPLQGEFGFTVAR